MEELDAAALQGIIEKAKKGDGEAFSFLYTKYFTPLYRYIYFRVPHKTDADDLVQDVFIKAYTSFNRYTYSGTSPLAYFYTIARNTIIDFRRKKKVLVLDEEHSENIPDTVHNPEQLAVQDQDNDLVHAIIARLPEDYQDVIVWRFIDGRSTKEIATLINKTQESVRQIQSRALKLLRKYIHEQ